MLTVVGSIAFDTVTTPFGTRERILGGSCTHFSLAASYFTEVRAVGVVGADFDGDHLEVFHNHGIDTQDVERIDDGLTFFWRGEYGYDLNDAVTHETQLNVFADFQPKLSAPSREADMLFLGNIQPQLQRHVLDLCDPTEFVALDSMNLWIENDRDDLLSVISAVDAVLVNDAELRELTRRPNMVKAALDVLGCGPRAVVAKLGEYGAALFTEEGFFALPAFPLETVLDPTGAGDSFAGGFLGFLDAHRGEPLDDQLLRRAMTYGSVMASFNVERFGVERMRELTYGEINERFSQFKRITHFEEIPMKVSRIHLAHAG